MALKVIDCPVDINELSEVLEVEATLKEKFAVAVVLR
jgi:hypothetical protein